MCIRDRFQVVTAPHGEAGGIGPARLAGFGVDQSRIGPGNACLLYTSDAADERSSVDLGGRRIIKKKTQQQTMKTHSQP